MDTCNHGWKYIRDWEGDPGVINGVHDLSHWECIHCGEQVSHPDDLDEHEDVDEPDEDEDLPY